MSAIEAIDIFIESDTSGDGEDGPSLISVRVPYERDFAKQIKELGAKWDDQSKEWQLNGTEELVKQVVAHAAAVHGITDVTPELAAKVKSAIRDHVHAK